MAVAADVVPSAVAAVDDVAVVAVAGGEAGVRSMAGDVAIGTLGVLAGVVLMLCLEGGPERCWLERLAFPAFWQGCAGKMTLLACLPCRLGHPCGLRTAISCGLK